MQSVLISEKDFRVGNFFYGNYEIEEDEKIHSVICKILGYHPYNSFFWVENKEGIEEFCSFQKIPITEEWLFKLGFFKYNNAYVLEKPTENIMNFKFSIWNDFTYNSSEFPIELKYVHQLQNLYFALTQRELTVA